MYCGGVWWEFLGEVHCGFVVGGGPEFGGAPFRDDTLALEFLGSSWCLLGRDYYHCQVGVEYGTEGVVSLFGEIVSTCLDLVVPVVCPRHVFLLSMFGSCIHHVLRVFPRVMLLMFVALALTIATAPMFVTASDS